MCRHDPMTARQKSGILKERRKPAGSHPGPGVDAVPRSSSARRDPRQESIQPTLEISLMSPHLADDSAPKVVAFHELPGITELELDPTEWFEVSQDQVNSFAELSGDTQWIHVDPERASQSPFGSPLVHGILVLGMVAGSWSEMIEITGADAQLNYGSDRLRFISPLRPGQKIRIRAKIVDVSAVSGGYQLTVEQVVEAQKSTRPILYVQSLYRVLGPASHSPEAGGSR